MRWVAEAVTKPQRCAVLPHVGRTHPLGFFDTGSEMPGKGDQWDNHIYVSVVAAQLMAVEMGWASPESVDELKAEIDRLKGENERLEEELNAAEVVLSAIDTLESRDFRARKKPGRPSKKEEGVAA